MAFRSPIVSAELLIAEAGDDPQAGGRSVIAFHHHAPLAARQTAKVGRVVTGCGRVSGGVGGKGLTQASSLPQAAGLEQAWEAGRRTPGVACNMAEARLLAGDRSRDYKQDLRSLLRSELRRGLAFAREQVSIPLSATSKAARHRLSDTARVASPLDCNCGDSPLAGGLVFAGVPG